MKRHLAWLALPILLLMLVWGEKWHGDHPAPTKQDSELRALMASSSQTDLLYSRYLKKSYKATLSKREVAPLADSFNLSPDHGAPSYMMMGKSGIIYVSFSFTKPMRDGTDGVNIYLPLDQRSGKIDFPNGSGGSPKEQKLHPATVKRWINLLIENPRIGPEIQSRLNGG